MQCEAAASIVAAYLPRPLNGIRTKTCGWVQAEKRLKEESERVHLYLDKVSEEKLLKECEQQLLANHQTALLDKEETGCRALLREQKTEGNPDACFGCARFHPACFCHGKHTTGFVDLCSNLWPVCADLQRMYQLFKRLPNTSNACGLQPISQIVREHIVDVSSHPALLAMGDNVLRASAACGVCGRSTCADYDLTYMG